MAHESLSMVFFLFLLRFYFGQCVQHYFQNIFHFFVFPTLVLSYLDVTFLSRPCRDAPPGRASLRFRITKFSFFSRLLYFIPIRTIKTNQKNQHEFYLFPAKPEQHKTVSSCVTSRRIPTYAANALVEMGDSLKQMADVKYSLDDNIKQNFLEPLHQLQTKDLKEVMVSRTRIVLFCNVFVARTSKAQQNNVNEPMSKCQQWVYPTHVSWCLHSKKESNFTPFQVLNFWAIFSLFLKK